MSDAETLGTCPFCGGAAELRSGVGEFWAYCVPCEASGRPSSKSEVAIAAWNRRPHQGAGMRERVRRIVDFTIADARLHNNLDDLSDESVNGIMSILSAIQGAEPVAWRVKDYADGWFLATKAGADLFSERGHLVEPLYTAPPSPDTGLVGELVEGLRPFAEVAPEFGGHAPQADDASWTLCNENGLCLAVDLPPVLFRRAATLLARAEQGGA
jgi:hypothetical protein